MNPAPARRRVTRPAQLLAVAVALAAAWMLILSGAAPAATSHVGKGQLSAARDAVEQSGVGGIAWYVDGASGRVVVTADRTVSAAEVATIKRSAGANAGAIRIKHVPRCIPAAAVGRGCDLRRRVPLLARLQRGQRKHLLLLDRGSLREARQHLVRQLGPEHTDRPDRQLQLPG